MKLSIGFPGLLTIAFIVLKLIHYITWSWWWVLCPLWIPPAFAVLLFIMFLIGIGILTGIMALLTRLCLH
jgi:hypothetical protein